MESLELKKGLSYRHHAIINLMVAQPQLSQGEIADILGYTQPWVSRLTSSDAFRAELQRRRGLQTSDLTHATVIKAFSIAEKAAKVVERALESDECDPRFALDAHDKALQRLGFATKTQPGVVLNDNRVLSIQNISESERSAAQAAQERLINRGKTIEHEAEDKI